MTEPFMAKSCVKTNDEEKKRHTQKEQAAPEGKSDEVRLSKKMFRAGQ